MTITLYFLTLIILSVCDSIWLFSMGANYKMWLGHIFAPTFTYTPAVIFYLFYAIGLVYFVIAPAIQNGTSLLSTFFIGAFLGLLAYAAYDLTNHATLQNWPLVVTVVDMAWGAFLSGITSTLVVYIYTAFIK